MKAPARINFLRGIAEYVGERAGQQEMGLCRARCAAGGLQLEGGLRAAGKVLAAATSAASVGGSFAEQGSVSKATSRLLLAQLASFLLSFQSYVILGHSS